MSALPTPASASLPQIAPTLPLDEARALVRPLWQAAFGQRAAGRDAHLLRTSVGLRRLTRFQDALQEAVGVRPPIGVLLQLGSVEAVANAIASGAWPSSSTLLPMREGTPGSAMVIVAAASGLILELCDLATALDFEGTVWGLQAPGIDGECTPFLSVEAIARHHVETLEKRGVQGAISLLGYSFSGLIVVEMARLMRARGYRVELLGLLDSNCFQRYWPRGAWFRFALRKVGRRLSELRGMSAAAAWQHLSAQAQAMQRMRQRRRHEAAAATATTASSAPAQGETLVVQQSMYYIPGLPEDLQKVRDASIIAFEAYKPAPVEGALVLFKSTLGDAHACDPEPVWRRLAPRLEVVTVPGSHTTMVRKPYVLQLAQEVIAALARNRQAANDD